MKIRSILSLFIIAMLATACDNDSTSSNDDGEQPVDQPVSNQCDDGLADGTYACNSIDLVARVPAGELLVDAPVGGVLINDIWGWTDQQTGKEYALVGLNDGVTFVDISDAVNPVVLGKLPQPASASKLIGSLSSASPDKVFCSFKGSNEFFAEQTQQAASVNQMGSVWRDMKVFNDHMFVVADGQLNHGMQVFDLSQLRNVENPPVTFQALTRYDAFNAAHNIAINEETGFAYIVGIGSGRECARNSYHVVDINDPANPTLAACYQESEATNFIGAPGYIHDTVCLNYNGPDSDYTGRELCFSSAEEGFYITDMSDKANIQNVNVTETGFNRYAHQGWLSEDHRYFFMNDELDELNIGRNTQTFVFDLQDLDDPQFVGTLDFDVPSIDHNLYVHNGLIFESNYSSGLRVLDASAAANGDLEEVGFFDTYPADNNANFEGTWSNYPFFESGNIIVSDITGGLFILRLAN